MRVIFPINRSLKHYTLIVKCKTIVYSIYLKSSKRLNAKQSFSSCEAIF